MNDERKLLQSNPEPIKVVPAEQAEADAATRDLTRASTEENARIIQEALTRTYTGSSGGWKVPWTAAEDALAALARIEARLSEAEQALEAVKVVRNKLIRESDRRLGEATRAEARLSDYEQALRVVVEWADSGAAVTAAFGPNMHMGCNAQFEGIAALARAALSGSKLEDEVRTED